MSRPREATGLLRPHRANSPEDPEGGYGSMAPPGASSSRRGEGQGPSRHGHDRSTARYDDNDDRGGGGDGDGHPSRWPRLPGLYTRLEWIFSNRPKLSEQEVDEEEFLHRVVTCEEVKAVMGQAQASLAKIVDLMKANDWDKYYMDSARGNWASASVRYQLLMQLADEMNAGPNLLTACMFMNSVAVSTGKRKEVMPPEAYKAAHKFLWALNGIGSEPDSFAPILASAAATAPDENAEDDGGGGDDEDADEVDIEKKNKERREKVWANLGKAFDEFSGACQKTVDEAEKVNKVYVKVLGKRGWTAAGIVFGVFVSVLGAMITHDWRKFFGGRNKWPQSGLDPPHNREHDYHDDGKVAGRETELEQLEQLERLDIGADERVYGEWSRSQSRSPSRSLPGHPHHDSSYTTAGGRSSLSPASEGCESSGHAAGPHQWAQQPEQQGRFVDPSTHVAGLTPVHDTRARARYDENYPSSNSHTESSYSSNNYNPNTQYYHRNQAYSRRPDCVRGYTRDDDDDADGYHTPTRTQQQEQQQQQQQQHQHQYSQTNHPSTSTSTQAAPQTIYDVDLQPNYDGYPASPPFSPTSPSTTYPYQENSILGVIEDESLLTRSRRASDAAMGAYQMSQDAVASATTTQWGSPTKF